MPHKLTRIERLRHGPAPVRRPVMVALAGDSAAGKTTLTRGLAQLLGPERVTTIGVDDYHRYDRRERADLPFTALHPECNHIEIMEQHLQLVATGHRILKPVYDHDTGLLTRPRLVEPREFVIVEGLLPLHTPLTRACFDLAIYLDPPEEIRHRWKVERDTRIRGYAPAQVRAELRRRERESAEFIRPQRAHADIIVRFAPAAGDPPGAQLSAELVLRPTVPHPDLSAMLTDEEPRAIQLRLSRDEHGRPVDTLRVRGRVPPEESHMVQKAIWSRLGVDAGDPPASLGDLGAGTRSEPLAVTQLLLLYHLLTAAR